MCNNSQTFESQMNAEINSLKAPSPNISETKLLKLKCNQAANIRQMEKLVLLWTQRVSWADGW